MSLGLGLVGAAVVAVAQGTTLLYPFSSIPVALQLSALLIVGLTAAITGVVAMRRGWSIWIAPALVGVVLGVGLVLAAAFLALIAWIFRNGGPIGPF